MSADFTATSALSTAIPTSLGRWAQGTPVPRTSSWSPIRRRSTRSRSEIGPLPEGNAIYPAATLSLVAGIATLTRTDPTTVNFPDLPGREIPFGYEQTISDPRQIVTLPGSGFFSFPDEWQPVLTSDPTGYAAPDAVTGTYNYAPISGQRDILGYIRAPQAGSPGIGYGSNPFIDIGAYQYVNLHPPEVTGVTETPTARCHAGQLLQRRRHLRNQHDALDDQHHVQWPDRSQHDQRQHGQPRRSGQQPGSAARPADQPGRQALL